MTLFSQLKGEGTILNPSLSIPCSRLLAVFTKLKKNIKMSRLYPSLWTRAPCSDCVKAVVKKENTFFLNVLLLMANGSLLPRVGLFSYEKDLIKSLFLFLLLLIFVCFACVFF